MGEAHPFVSGCPQLPIIRPSSPGASDPKKQYSGTPAGPAQCGIGDGVGPGQPGRGLAEEGCGPPESLSLPLAAGGQERKLLPHQAWPRSEADLFQCFSPFHPRGLSLRALRLRGRWHCPLTQLPAPAPLFPLVPSGVSSRPAPHAAQTTLGFANHGSGEMRAGHLPPLCAWPGPGWLC